MRVAVLRSGQRMRLLFEAWKEAFEIRPLPLDESSPDGIISIRPLPMVELATDDIAAIWNPWMRRCDRQKLKIVILYSEDGRESVRDSRFFRASFPSARSWLLRNSAEKQWKSMKASVVCRSCFRRVLAVGMMALSLVPFAASADTETVGSVTWTYSVSNGKAIITESSAMTGDLVIPSTLGGYPVSSIDSHAFYVCSGLTLVTIPSSVMSIQKGADLHR